MYAKRIKRRCMVRGCANIDVYSISRTRELGNTVIICEECLKAALGAIADTVPKNEMKEAVTPPETEGEKIIAEKSKKERGKAK